MRTTPLFGALVLALPIVARAQDGGLPPAFQSLPMDNMMLDGLKRNLDNATGVSGRGRVRHPAGRPSPKKPTTFRPSPAVTRRTVSRYVAWAKIHSPRAAGELAKGFAQESPARMWQGIVAKDGVRADDLADVYGEYWATLWSLATGNSKTPEQTRGLVEQFRPMIATPRRPTTDADRQSMAEGLMLDTIQVAFSTVKMVRRNDTAAYARLRDSAALRFRQNFGTDAASLRLTDHGFARA